VIEFIPRIEEIKIKGENSKKNARDIAVGTLIKAHMGLGHDLGHDQKLLRNNSFSKFS
jgi:hypothetical protein